MQVSKQSAGGKASALIQKKKSEEAYYASPVFCKNCEKMLVPKEGEKFPSVRNRKFCDKSCAGTFNNQKFPKRKAAKAPLCKGCSINPRPKSQVAGSFRYNFFCNECLDKKDRSLRRKSEVTHRDIRGHARTVLSQEHPDKSCERCGYSKHVECCHKKPVASYPEDTIVSEINSIDNLIWLCPNCHWEFDHDLTE